MADSFFGFDTSLSNLNDDEGGGDGSEEEYDALNDETFGYGNDELDWEVEHEQLAYELESSRRHEPGIDDMCNSQLEASLSQLVLDETDAPQHTLGSSVWRHEPNLQLPTQQPLKNVCTVEELERQLRQTQQPQPQPFNNQNFFQPRFPVILQRPPGLQGPVPLPFAPQQPMNQLNQPLNKIMTQNAQINPMGQTNQMIPNHVNQLGQNVNQLGQNMNQLTQNVNQFMQHSQMGQFQNNHPNNMMMSQNMHQNNQMMQNQMGINQNMNQLGQNLNQMSQNVNQMPQNMNQMAPNLNHMGQPNQIQNVNQMGQNMNQMGQNVNQMGQSVSQMGKNVNQMGQNVNQMGQNVNQMGQNVNHVMPNGNQFGQMNQFHMMGQNRMMVPPPGMNMPRQNFSPNMGQFNHNFRGPMPKPNEQPNMIFKNQQINMTNQLNQNNHNQNQMSQNVNQLAQNMNQLGQNVNQLSQNVNQLGQNVSQTGQNVNVSPNKVAKTEKKQQTRIYNNSKIQNNMTSQNLVQLIQNTHPMLQFNSGFHNANHHPMLTRNQFSNVHPMMNQRHNGSFSSNTSNNISVLNGSDTDSDCDEYAGLMTQREKQWLINIQMLQLNTGTPYIHDFYYTVFLERQAQKEKEGVKEAHKVNQLNHPFYSGGVKQETLRRERHNSGRHNSTSEDPPRTYVPTQFENSLGKLQCGSVTAPRKIIDVELVGSEGQPSNRPSRAPSVASTTTPAEVPREMKRTKQLLLDIEALYLILLRLEELNDPLAISNALILKEREEKQRQLEEAQKELENEQEDESNVFLKNIESVQRRPKQDSPKSETIDKRQVVNLAVPLKPVPVKNLLDEDKDELVNKMFVGLLHGDRLMQMLTVRKGRALVCRFVSRVCSTHSRLRPLWCRVLRAAPSLARRHEAGAHIAALARPYTEYIENSTGWTAVLESCCLFTEALDPARTPYILTTAFTLTCVCALIEKAGTLINTIDATANERQWFRFLKTLARGLKNTNLTVARPLRPLSESKVTHHLKQLDSRSTIEILQRGKPAEFADLTKTDVHEQLVKHLCI